MMMTLTITATAVAAAAAQQEQRQGEVQGAEAGAKEVVGGLWDSLETPATSSAA